MHNLIHAPPQPPSLSSRNTYTTWPGGVDPTASLFNTDNQKIGGKRTRKQKKTSRKTRHRKQQRKRA